MRTLFLDKSDGPRSARLIEASLPQPAAGEARVAIKAASLNHRELWITRGQYPGMQLPATLGCDGAGVVDAVGEGVDPDWVGREVLLYPGLGWGADQRFPAPGFGLLGMPGPGTIADAIVVPAANLALQPGHLDFRQAAALPLGGVTAWRGLYTKAGLKRGERLLITGIGGGVATFALLFAVASGAEVWVTSGSDHSIAEAVKLGAKGGFNYKNPQWKKALIKASGGIDVAFDGAPAESYPAYSRSLAMGARVVVYGSTGGVAFPVNAPELFLKNVIILGTNVGSPDDFAAMLKFVEAHRIVPVIDREFDLDHAGEALLYLEQGHRFGKITIHL